MLSETPLFRDLVLRLTFGASLGFLLFITVLTAIKLRGMDHLILIYSGGMNGPNFLGTIRDVWGIIGTGFMVVIVNAFLAVVLRRRVVFFSRLIGVATVVFSILIFIAVAAIISAN